jgi:hypothetical protein
MKIDELIKELESIKAKIGNIDVKFIKESYGENEEFEGDEQSLKKENIRIEDEVTVCEDSGVSKNRAWTVIKGHKIIIK